MRIYTVRFEFFGYRAQCTFIAKDEEAAKEYIRNKVEFLRIIPKAEIPDGELSDEGTLKLNENIDG